MCNCVIECFICESSMSYRETAMQELKQKHFLTQAHVAEDQKKIALLLSLNHMTEHDIVYLSSFPQHRVDQSQFIQGGRNVKGEFIICFQNE